VNSDLVGKYVNIASRAAGFLTKYFSGEISDLSGGVLLGQRGGPSQVLKDPLIEKILEDKGIIRTHYDGRRFGLAVSCVMALADKINQFWDQQRPWDRAKQASELSQGGTLHVTCSAAIEGFRLLTIFLKPILPRIAGEVERLLNIDPLSWSHLDRTLPRGHRINSYEHIASRVEEKQLDALFEPAAATPATRSPQAHAERQEHAAKGAAVIDTISIDDFNKVDLRVAKILKAEHVDGADKLLKLTLDLGGTTRTVFAGIKSAYDPAAIEGRLTVMVANLAPRKMKFGVSEGMVLAASGEGPGIFLLSPDSGAQPGMKVK